MMIILNGERRDVTDDITVHGLLRAMELEQGAVAVAVNSVFVPRSEHTSRVLATGDAVELLAPMQGG